MSHVDEGTLHALVDDALDAAERDAVQAHLASCGDCARRFAEATAMARQVHELLGALDEAPVAVRVQAARAATAVATVVAAPDVIALPRRRAPLVTLRRIAIAASVLVVAGVSYRMGGTSQARFEPETTSAVAANDAPTPDAVAMPASGAMPAADAAPAVASVPQAVVEPSRTAESVERLSASRRAVRTAAGAAPAVEDRAVASRAESAQDIAAPVRAMAPSANAAPAPTSLSAPASVAAPAPVVASAAAEPAPEAAAMGAARAKAMPAPAGAVRKLVPLPGYTAVEEQSLPSVTRRRYVSSAGTPLVLVIVQGAEAPKAARSTLAAPEFTVRTANGATAVRWTANGASYELTGALPPDSLVKLATQLR